MTNDGVAVLEVSEIQWTESFSINTSFSAQLFDFLDLL